MLLLSSLFIAAASSSTGDSSTIMAGESLGSAATSPEGLDKDEDNSVTSATQTLRQSGHRNSKMNVVQAIVSIISSVLTLCFISLAFLLNSKLCQAIHTAIDGYVHFGQITLRQNVSQFLLQFLQKDKMRFSLPVIRTNQLTNLAQRILHAVDTFLFILAHCVEIDAQGVGPNTLT